MKSHVYADHAATTPLCDAAWDAMAPFLRDEFGNPSSRHSWAKKPREAVWGARETIARWIFFTSGGTEADNWVMKGSVGGLMVSSYEHHAVLEGHSIDIVINVMINCLACEKRDS